MRGRLDVALLTEPHLAGGAVGQAGHHIVVDARQRVHALGQAVDALQGIVVKDIPFLDFHRQDDVVGAAEGIANAVVQLDVGMLLRQQVGEIRDDTHCRNLQRKKYRDGQDDQHGQPGPGEDHLVDLVNLRGKSIHGLLILVIRYAPVSMTYRAPAPPPTNSSPSATGTAPRR